MCDVEILNWRGTNYTIAVDGVSIVCPRGASEVFGQTTLNDSTTVISLTDWHKAVVQIMPGAGVEAIDGINYYQPLWKGAQHGAILAFSLVSLYLLGVFGRKIIKGE